MSTKHNRPLTTLKLGPISFTLLPNLPKSGILKNRSNPATRMFAVILVPEFFLQAVLRHQPELRDSAVALLSEAAANAPIIEMTFSARSAGVNMGMTSTQAMARCPQIVVQARSSQAESSAQQALLQTAFCFSPFVEATQPGICTLDLRGQPIAKKPVAPSNALDVWSRKIIEVASSIHLRAQVGVAATPGLALLAARFADPFLAVENPKAFTLDLPIESLDPSPEVNGILKRWGIHTVGQLVALGKEGVAERLGAETLLLFKRASADETRPLTMALAPEVFVEALEFPNEVETLEPLLFILRRFIEQLSVRLEAVYLVAGELKLTLTMASAATCERIFKVPSPTRNVETLFRMVFTHLENFTTPSPITALSLEAIPSRTENHQFALFETSLRDPNHFFETVARLNALLGTDRVGTPVVQDSHRPDDFKMEPVKFKDLEEELTTKRRRRAATAEPHEALALKHGMALRRFRPPLPAEVQMERDRPVYLSSTKVRGRIAHAVGPWRVSGQWWEKPWVREEWDIETVAGRLCRIYQDGASWFLEGLFD